MGRRRKTKKRDRSILEIQADLEQFKERYRKHLLWEERNKRFCEIRQQYRLDDDCVDIEERIKLLRRSKDSYTKLFGIIRTHHYTAEVRKALTSLHEEVKAAEDKAEDKALREVPELWFSYERFPNSRNMYSDWTTIPHYLEEELALAKDKDRKQREMELAIAKEKDRKKEKERVLRARVAQADGKTRDVAESVKGQLARKHVCPYCGGDLGDNPHADHIYPVSRGGLSTKANMVYVCMDCNLKKSDMTLRIFIEEYGLNRDLIEERLASHGKEF